MAASRSEIPSLAIPADITSSATRLAETKDALIDPNTRHVYGKVQSRNAGGPDTARINPQSAGEYFFSMRIPRESAADSSACRAGVPRHAGPRVTGRCYSRSVIDVRQRALAVLAAAADFCLRIDSPLSVSR